MYQLINIRRENLIVNIWSNSGNLINKSNHYRNLSRSTFRPQY